MSSAAAEPNPVREFVIAGHGNLSKVRSMLEQDPSLLNVRYQWGEGDLETAIQAAAQVGSVQVAEFLLSRGAPLEVCTAAMLGRKEVVERMLLADPKQIDALGAHRIPLLPHAALSGDVALLRMVWEKGARQGSTLALVNAVSRGRTGAAGWLIENAKPDLAAKNFEGKSLLQVAEARKDEPTAALLKAHGAV